MADDFHRPVQFGGREFEAFAGRDLDPAALMRTAHQTAHAIVSRARESDDPAVVERLVSYTDDHGIDCLLYTSPSPRDGLLSRMPSSA